MHDQNAFDKNGASRYRVMSLHKARISMDDVWTCRTPIFGLQLNQDLLAGLVAGLSGTNELLYCYT